jgi:hypothetical protein
MAAPGNELVVVAIALHPEAVAIVFDLVENVITRQAPTLPTVGMQNSNLGNGIQDKCRGRILESLRITKAGRALPKRSQPAARRLPLFVKCVFFEQLIGQERGKPWQSRISTWYRQLP